jgi:hypothetical protein
LANIHSHYADAVYNAAGGFTFTGRMRITAADGGVGVTFLSDYANTDTYYRLRRYGTNAFHLSPHGTATLSGDTDSGVVPSTNTWYLFKIEVTDTGSRTEIKAKVWAAGAAEPAYWQIDAYDGSAARLTSGKVGLWSYSSGSKYWDDIAVETVSNQNQYVLTASSGANGSIAPNGPVTVDAGTSQTFTFAPSINYHVADVRVDGTSIGKPASYTFSNVAADHTIAVDFALNQYLLTATSGANGSIAPSGAVSATYGGSQTFSFTPADHYRIADVKVDGVSVGTPGSYTFDNISANHAIEVTYAPQTYMVTVTSGAHGSISPNGMIEATHGQTIDFTFTADPGYHIKDVLVDGASVGAISSYSLQNVTGDHAITVAFAFNLNPPLNLHVFE